MEEANKNGREVRRRSQKNKWSGNKNKNVILFGADFNDNGVITAITKRLARSKYVAVVDNVDKMTQFFVEVGMG